MRLRTSFIGGLRLLALLGAALTGTAGGQEVPSQGTAGAAGNELDEIVVTGYTVSKKKDIVGAVSVVDLKETVDKPVAGILQALQGEIPGVQINTDGNPGGGASILIRGQGLGPLGFNAPLFIVDGVPLNVNTGLEELNPGDIESIQVLKDAASASIYGARAANGVIVITTKRGTGHMDVDVQATLSYQDLQPDITPLNTLQRAQVWYTVDLPTPPDNASSIPVLRSRYPIRIGSVP
jgi:TonB-dependent SusC/RagA subfamily outer membrane receptor